MWEGVEHEEWRDWTDLAWVGWVEAGIKRSQ